MEIASGSDGTSLNQRKYVLDIISNHGLRCCKPTTTPLPPGMVLSQGTEEMLLDPEIYRRLVGQLLFLNLTRPDISHATQQLSQYMAKPTLVHWNVLIHVLTYLKSSPSLGVFYPAATTFTLKTYTDADWGSCVDSRNSLTGFCVFMGSSLISWRCKEQTTVSVSSAKAEYRAMATTTRELTLLHNMLGDFHIKSITPISLLYDNQAATQITKNSVFHECTKHLDIDCQSIYMVSLVLLLFLRLIN